MLLLELWQGEEFLGEAVVPSERHPVQTEAEVHTLRLTVGSQALGTRPDTRKNIAAQSLPARSLGQVTVSTKWLNQDGHLQFSLLYAEGFPLRQETTMSAETLGSPPGPR